MTRASSGLLISNCYQLGNKHVLNYRIWRLVRIGTNFHCSTYAIIGSVPKNSHANGSSPFPAEPLISRCSVNLFQRFSFMSRESENVNCHEEKKWKFSTSFYIHRLPFVKQFIVSTYAKNIFFLLHHV